MEGGGRKMRKRRGEKRRKDGKVKKRTPEGEGGKKE